ncbi:MAG: hypothetical protein DRH30_09270 [Deltaproteobacteria bacterium]|nr:MAG: hypothetical protein DRH30_09270 [Deltaproteobacteria bacterium]
MNDVNSSDGVLVRIVDAYHRVGSGGIPFMRIFVDTFEGDTETSLTFWFSPWLDDSESDRICNAFGVDSAHLMKDKWATLYISKEGGAPRGIRPAMRKDMEPFVASTQREVAHQYQRVAN